jgi:L-aminopeptidase/D-esterase-like protein
MRAPIVTWSFRQRGHNSMMKPVALLLLVVVSGASWAQGQFDATTGDFFAGYTLGTTDSAVRTAQVAPAAEGDELMCATTIAVVATNARLTKAQAKKVAQMADDGLARAIRPAHGTGDGDTVFALATGTATGTASLNQIGGAAADALSRAIICALMAARAFTPHFAT